MTRTEISQTIRKILTDKFSVQEEELTEESVLSDFLDYDMQCCMIIYIEEALKIAFTVSDLEELYNYSLKTLTDLSYEKTIFYSK